MTGMVTVVSMGPLVIDTRSPEPSYVQLARQLRDRIRAGEYAPGAPLPSIQRIVQETGLAVNTVRHAIAVLADEGWVVTVPGRGTYAAEKRPDLGQQPVLPAPLHVTLDRRPGYAVLRCDALLAVAAG
jgi:DNA-binding transcriptional regulator YhcF (GntR family)